jgi:thymidylate kinase
MRNTVRVVTFSGIDGAGKSTQIEALTNRLRDEGFHVVMRTFWDDVAACKRFREFVSHNAFKGDKGAGSPERPINRRDKNVSTWYVTCSRFVFYVLDAFRLRLAVRRISPHVDFVVFDRYLFDELANLPLHGRFTRLYLRMLLKISPQPDLAVLLDADPEAARTRKPEYPLEFLQRNRDAYIALSQLVDRIRLIEPLPVESAKLRIAEAVSQFAYLRCGRSDGVQLSRSPAHTAGS